MLDVERIGTLYRVINADAQLCFEFDNVRETYTGILSEVTIRMLGIDDKNIIHGPTRIDLLSSRDIWSMSENLKDRFPAMDWLTAITSAASKAVREYKEAGRSVRLADIEYKPLQMLVGNFIPANETMIIAAPGGSGKSFLAMGLAVACASGRPLIAGFLEPERQMNVLYLDWETGGNGQAYRAGLIAAGMGLLGLPEGLYYRKMDRSISQAVKSIIQEINDNDIELVIVDSIGFAAGGELERSDVAIQTMNALNQFTPAARLCLAHVAKGEQDKGASDRNAFGSVFFRESARSQWSAEVTTSEDDNYIQMGLFHTKYNLGRKQPSFGIEITFVNDEIRFAYCDIKNSPSLMEHASPTLKICGYLGSVRRAMTTKEIADNTGIKPSVARATLNNLAQKGIAVRVSHGGGAETSTWALVSKREVATADEWHSEL